MESFRMDLNCVDSNEDDGGLEPTPLLAKMISRQSSHNPPPNQQQGSGSSTSTIRTSNEPVPHMGQVHVPRQQIQQQQLQQQQHHHPSVVSNSHVIHDSSSHMLGGSSSSSSAANRAQMEREQKKAKEQFLMFTRVLMKYLEKKDPSMHARAKQVIKECAAKNKRKEPGFESVTESMKIPLRATVGESYWNRAECYLTHFQAAMLKRKMANVTVGVGSSETKSSSWQSQVPLHGQPQSPLLSSQQHAQDQQQHQQQKFETELEES